MDLRPSEEQQQLVEAFRDLFADAAPPDKVRAAEPLGHAPALWDRLVATGAVEMAVPESAGGGGASLLDLALVAEQHGRHVAPAPGRRRAVTSTTCCARSPPCPHCW